MEKPLVNENKNLQTFGRYSVVRLLGEGAMGRVFLAEDPVLQRHLAVKVIAIDRDIDQRTRDEFLKRFNVEARASARLNHPAIVTVHDAGTDEQGLPWIAFEYVEGERLEDLLKREGPLPVSKAITFSLDVVSALGHAHLNHIIHRDIKPANILIDKCNGIAKLADFGVVKSPWSSVTMDGNVIGSPGYMSPEQIDGKEVDARSDLFSFGTMFYQMLTGVHPFVRDTIPSTLFATLNCTYKPIREIREDLPDGIEIIINGLLVSDRDKRISTAEDLLKLLSSVTGAGEFVTVNKTRRIPIVPSNSNVINDDLLLQFTATLKKTYKAVVKGIHGVIESPLTKKTLLFCKDTSLKLKIAVVKKAPVVTKAGVENFKKVKKSSGIVLSELSLNLKKNKHALKRVIWSAVVIFGLLVFASIVNQAATGLTPRDKSVLRELAQEEGYKGSPSELMKKCRQYIAQDHLRDASTIANAISKVHIYKPLGSILLARIAIRDLEFDDAKESFEAVQGMKKGRSLIHRESKGILDDFESAFKKDDASKDGIGVVVWTLALADENRVRKWVESDDYYLRWNGVRIQDAAHNEVDMVEVYVKDLKSDKIRARLRACEKMGELGDKRAIPALESVEKNFLKDPFVAASASTVLNDHFRK